jgi:hypothetical protein
MGRRVAIAHLWRLERLRPVAAVERILYTREGPRRRWE